MNRSKRKPSWIGVQTQVCGYKVSRRHNLICLLPATILHTVHTSMAILQPDNEILICQLDQTNDTHIQEREGEWVKVVGLPTSQ